MSDDTPPPAEPAVRADNAEAPAYSDAVVRDFGDRAESPYTLKEKIGRVLWNYLGQRLFSLTFHNWYGVRNGLLRMFGGTVGRPVRIRPSVRIEQPWNLTIGDECSIGDRAVIYCLGKVTLSDFVSISQHAHLCAGTHDWRKPDLPLMRPPIVVEEHVWIAADAYVGPGVTVRAGGLIGARACVFKDTEPWTIYGGNPAKPLRERPRFEQPPSGAA
jgi:putative colanic acid biosynthesis acetyltransferase WcaF